MKAWQKKDIIHAVRRFYAAEGRWPRAGDFPSRAFPGLSLYVVWARCGTLEAARRAAGAVSRRVRGAGTPRRWTRELAILAFADWYGEHGRWPYQSEYGPRHGLPCRFTLQLLVGPIALVRELAGGHTYRRKPRLHASRVCKWDAARIVVAFQKFYKRRGRYPLVSDLLKQHGLPCWKSISRIYPTLAAARLAAGASDGGGVRPKKTHKGEPQPASDSALVEAFDALRRICGPHYAAIGDVQNYIASLRDDDSSKEG